MAFSDPISITVSGNAKSMARISSSGTSSVYQTGDGLFRLEITHVPTKGGRIRSTMRFTRKAIVADPITAVNDEETLTFYAVIDRPSFGFVDTDVNALKTGFNAWLTDTVGTKLFGMES